MSLMPRILPLLLAIVPFISHADVELTDQARRNFAIEIAQPALSSQVRSWQATAEVVDPGSLLNTVAQLRAAQVATKAVQRELAREEALQKNSDNIAQRDVDNTRAQLAASRASEQSLYATLPGTWGTAISKLSDTQLDSLVQQLNTSAVVLLRVELSAVMPAKFSPQMLQLQLLNSEEDNDNGPISASLLGRMPLVATQNGGLAWLASMPVNAVATPQPGELFRALLQDPALQQSGYKVPRAALVRWQGQDWVFVETDANHFTRHAVRFSSLDAESVLLSEGLAAVDKVVVSGAGLLLGAEHASPDEEGGAEKDDD